MKLFTILKVRPKIDVMNIFAPYPEFPQHKIFIKSIITILFIEESHWANLQPIKGLLRRQGFVINITVSKMTSFRDTNPHILPDSCF